MAHRWHLLAVETGVWRLGRSGTDAQSSDRIDIPLEASAEQQAVILSEQLRNHGYQGEPIAVGINAQMCLVASMELSTTRQARDRQSLKYVLEEKLPLASEEFVADFLIEEKIVLGIAGEIASLGPLIEALAQQGVRVQSVSPTALLAAQEFVVQESPSERTVLLAQHDEEVEVVCFGKKLPRLWFHLPAEPQALQRSLRHITLDESQSFEIVAWNLSPELFDAIDGLNERQVESASPADWFDAAAATCSSILLGSRSAWGELCRDEVAIDDRYLPIRGSLQWAVTAAIVMLLSLSGSLLLRAHHYREMADRIYLEQEGSFHKVFPQAENVPSGIQSRIESEHTRLTGLHGSYENTPLSGSALVTLYEALSDIDPSLRFRLLEVRVDNSSVFLEGEVQTYSDADRLASSLRDHGFEVAAPRTERLPDRGVSVHVAAVYSSSPEQDQSGGS